MTDIIILTAYITAGYLLYKKYKRSQHRAITPELLNRIAKISQYATEYQKYQQLLFDIDHVSGDEIKGIALEWQSKIGDRRATDIFINSRSKSKQQLKRAILAVMEETSTLLDDELDRIPKRCRQYIDSTFTAHTEGEIKID